MQILNSWLFTLCTRFSALGVFLRVNAGKLKMKRDRGGLVQKDGYETIGGSGIA